MPVKLTTETNITVFLPSTFESDDRLESILDLALDQGATETSTIGPCIIYENSTASEAVERVRKVLKELGID